MRVELEHRHLDRHGDGWRSCAANVYRLHQVEVPVEITFGI